MPPLGIGATLTIACHMKNSYIEPALFNKQPYRLLDYFLVAESTLAAVESTFLAKESTLAAAESTFILEESTAILEESTFVESAAGAVEAPPPQEAKAVARAKPKITFFIFVNFKCLIIYNMPVNTPN